MKGATDANIKRQHKKGPPSMAQIKNVNYLTDRDRQRLISAPYAVLQEDGTPSMAEKAAILPPQSRMGAISDAEREASVKGSLLYSKYAVAHDPDSAYEFLTRRGLEEEAAKEEEKERLEEEKRQEQERESLIKFGTENALTKLIEVLDNFERGQKALENVEDCEKVKESFNLIQKQVFETLSNLGLEEIKAIGEEFDPNFHEAVMQTPTSEHPENTIIAELRKGYKIGDKVLRPTMVNVAAAE